jgi:hypothetical protein
MWTGSGTLHLNLNGFRAGSDSIQRIQVRKDDDVCSGAKRPTYTRKPFSGALPTPSVRGSRRRFAWNLFLPEQFGQVGPLQTEFGCCFRLIPPVPIQGRLNEFLAICVHALMIGEE